MCMWRQAMLVADAGLQDTRELAARQFSRRRRRRRVGPLNSLPLPGSLPEREHLVHSPIRSAPGCSGFCSACPSVGLDHLPAPSATS